jgi:hypothetical protein
MTQRVLYNETTRLVMQWQDTEQYNFDEPGPGTAIFVATPEQWANQTDPQWYIDGELTEVAPPPIPPTPAEILAANKHQQSILLTNAQPPMATALGMVMLGDASDTETLTAKAWQAYYRALQAVDLTAIDPTWPVAPT